MSCILVGLPVISPAQTRTLRIATYNIEDDINGATTPLPGLIAPAGNPADVASGGVLEGIGEEVVNGNAQPLDVLALEETTSNPITVTPIVNGLNAFYGIAGMYSNSPVQATQSGGSGNNANGNGPNAIVYNTRTVRLLASVPVDPPGGTGNLGTKSGEYREVMRYQFAPAGVATNATDIFYVYVSHYKSSASGTLETNQFKRNGEAQIVRSNAMTLSVTARILHVGDFNTGDTTEPMYSTLITPGTNQFLDPVNPSGTIGINWDGGSVLNVKTESAVRLHYRDDYQIMTTNIYYGAPGGLALVSGTYHAFGNNGSVAYLGSVNSGGNTSLNNRLITNGPVFLSAAQLYLDLTNASDHLPVVADYTIPLPAPRIIGISFSETNLLLTATNGVTNAIYSVLMNTNFAAPFATWKPLANYTATSGVFTLTATNAVDPSAPQRFFILQGK